MTTFIMLTKLSPEALARSESVEELKQLVSDRIRGECPGIRWIANYAILGPYDYLDIFEAPDSNTATKVSVIVRSLGHATTEIWVATPWEQFVKLAKVLKSFTVPSI